MSMSTEQPLNTTEAHDTKLIAQIEALLFWKGEPVTLSYIAKTLALSRDIVLKAITSLEQRLLSKNSGLRLAQIAHHDDIEIALTTHPEFGAMIQELTKTELQTDIGKAGLETLTIIAYCGPISRAHIEYIRGVQSQFIIRSLLIRGLIEKRDDPNDERRSLYAPSFDLLSFLGITKIEDLPDFEHVKKSVQDLLNQAS